MSKKNEHTNYTPVTQDEKEGLVVSVELLKQDVSYLKVGIDEIREELRQMRQDFKDWYVSRDEYASLVREVKDLKSLKDWAIKLVIGSVIIALLAIIGLRP